MIHKTGIKGLILLLMIVGIAAISGCVDREQPLPAMPPLNNQALTADFANQNLTYEGQIYIPTKGGGFILVTKMHDSSNGNDCYVTYNGISCEKGNASEGN